MKKLLDVIYVSKLALINIRLPTKCEKKLHYTDWIITDTNHYLVNIGPKHHLVMVIKYQPSYMI